MGTFRIRARIIPIKTGCKIDKNDPAVPRIYAKFMTTKARAATITVFFKKIGDNLSIAIVYMLFFRLFFATNKSIFLIFLPN